MSNPRETAFIPLSSASAPVNVGGSLSVTVLAQPGNIQPFRPLGQTNPPVPASDHQPACEPRITIQRDGDRVSTIHVHCSCGQIIELACVYEPAPAPR